MLVDAGNGKGSVFICRIMAIEHINVFGPQNTRSTDVLVKYIMYIYILLGLFKIYIQHNTRMLHCT